LIQTPLQPEEIVKGRNQLLSAQESLPLKSHFNGKGRDSSGGSFRRLAERPTALKVWLEDLTSFACKKWKVASRFNQKNMTGQSNQ